MAFIAFMGARAMARAGNCWNFYFLHRTKHKMEEEILNSLSFDSNNEEVMTSNPDSSASNPSAREVELEKEVARLTEKVEELSSFCRYVCKRLDSVEKTQNKFIDTASRKIQNRFETLELIYDERIDRIISRAEEEDKLVAEIQKKKIKANERQKVEAVLRDEIERQFLEKESAKHN